MKLNRDGKEISPPVSAVNTGFSLLPAVAGLFTGVLVLSNILAAKMLQIGPFVFDGGTILFPLSYIFGDILTEVYGYRAARKVIWTGFATLVLMSLSIAFVGVLPAQAEWTFQGDFDNILRQVPRIAVASILGYFSGEYVNTPSRSNSISLTNCISSSCISCVSPGKPQISVVRSVISGIRSLKCVTIRTRSALFVRLPIRFKMVSFAC